MSGPPPVLLLVDFQRGFEEIVAKLPRNHLVAEAHAAKVIEFWREKGWRVIHVRHDSTRPHSVFRPGRPGNHEMDFAIALPGEPVVRKQVHSAFIGTDLADQLTALGKPPVIVAGATTDHCVSTTVRMGANLGFDMVLAGDASFTFARTGPDGRTIAADDVHAAHLAS